MAAPKDSAADVRRPNTNAPDGKRAEKPVALVSLSPFFAVAMGARRSGRVGVSVPAELPPGLAAKLDDQFTELTAEDEEVLHRVGKRVSRRFFRERYGRPE